LSVGIGDGGGLSCAGVLKVFLEGEDGRFEEEVVRRSEDVESLGSDWVLRLRREGMWESDD